MRFLSVSTLLLLTALAGQARAQSDVSPERLAEARKLAKEITPAVERMRGLKFKKPVYVGVRTRKRLKTDLTKMFAEDLPQEKVDKYNAMLRTVGLIPKDGDIKEIYLGVLGGAIGGFYDQRTMRLFLVAEGPGGADNPQQRMQNAMLRMMGMTQEHLVMAHELTHALDDQHFTTLRMNLDQLENDDRLTAIKCLIEGSANVIQYDYMLAKRGADSSMLAGQDMLGQALGGQTGQPALDKAPLYVKLGLLAPYTVSIKFTVAIKAKGGWAAVNKAYADPPTSMEQVLHPEKYLDRDVAQTVDTAPFDKVMAAQGFERVGHETLGELFMWALLEEQTGDRALARQAAEGWDGDRYVVYRHGKSGKLAMALLSTFDTEADAKEFEGAYAKALAKKHAGAKAAGDGLWTVDGAQLRLRRDGKQVASFEGVDAATLAKLEGALAGATWKDIPGGMPKVDLLERRLAKPKGHFSYSTPKGWTAKDDAGGRYPLEMQGSNGTRVQVGMLEGSAVDAELMTAVKRSMRGRLSEVKVVKQELAAPAGTLQLHLSGVAPGETVRSTISLALVPLPKGALMVIYRGESGAWTADREDFARFLASIRATTSDSK